MHGEGASTLQVLLDEARTEVNVDLYQRRVTKRLETMDLARLNDKDISRAALEGFAVDRPHSAAFTNKLNLVIGVPVRARPRTRLSMKQEHRNARVSLLSSNKLMRATNKRQILLAGLDECGHNPVPRRTPVCEADIRHTSDCLLRSKRNSHLLLATRAGERQSHVATRGEKPTKVTSTHRMFSSQVDYFRFLSFAT